MVEGAKHMKTSSLFSAHQLFVKAALIAVLTISFAPMPATAATDDALGLDGLVNTDCPNTQHQTPIVLLHGTFASTKRAFSSLAPVLKADGHCLFAINYGRKSHFSFNGMNDINESTTEVIAFIQSVLQRTGAQQVKLIGHSQGGLLAFSIARSSELTGRVNQLIAIAPSLRGTTRVPSHFSSLHCPACAQQSHTSDFLTSLHEAPINPAGIPTLILATANDLVVTPVASQFLHEPNVQNVLLQEKHPDVRATHSGVMHTSEAIELIHAFLDDDIGH